MELVLYLVLILMVVLPFSLLLIVLPIKGIAEGDLFLILLGPGFVLYILVAKYLFSGHWLCLFRRKNDEKNPY